MMAATLAHGDDGDRQRRARAGGRRSRRLPGQDGRQDRGRGHLDASSWSGVASLGGARHAVLPDRIETGTYAMAVAMTGGDVTLEGTPCRPAGGGARCPDRARAPRSRRRTGGIRVRRNGRGIAPVDVTTEPFPGFPTDLQAQFMALMTRAERNVPHPRDDLREPVHARPGTGPPRCADPARR